MRTATIDYDKGVFHVEITEGGRVVALRSGTYRDVIQATREAGVARTNVTLSPTAQDAALSACFGGPA